VSTLAECSVQFFNHFKLTDIEHVVNLDGVNLDIPSGSMIQCLDLRWMIQDLGHLT
jgi:hypothetical protein